MGGGGPGGGEVLGAPPERQRTPGSARERWRARESAKERVGTSRRTPGAPGKANERAGERQGTRGMAARTHSIGSILVFKRSWCALVRFAGNRLNSTEQQPQYLQSLLFRSHQFFNCGVNEVHNSTVQSNDRNFCNLYCGVNALENYVITPVSCFHSCFVHCLFGWMLFDAF